MTAVRICFFLFIYDYSFLFLIYIFPRSLFVRSRKCYASTQKSVEVERPMYENAFKYATSECYSESVFPDSKEERTVRLALIRILSLAVLAVFLIIAVCPGVLEAQTSKIRIAYSSRSNTITPLYVAASKGFFREEGLEVELIQVSPRLGAMAVMNGDVSFTTSFVSTFRGILQGLPLKVILIALKKGMYFLVVRPEIKELQDLKGKKLGVATIRGTDQLVAAELLRSKGFDPALVQPLVIGETPLRAQALASGAVQAVSVSPPYDLILQQMGYKILAGPPEVGMPASGLFTSDRLLKENPQVVRRTLRAVMKANRFIADNRQETIAVMLKWLPQTADVAARSYDLELKAITPDGQMTDAEIESLIERLGEKKKPLDEVRDFSPVRQAIKELASTR
jgi:NitT/TauT family transport system substrate-binding protein